MAWHHGFMNVAPASAPSGDSVIPRPVLARRSYVTERRLRISLLLLFLAGSCSTDEAVDLGASPETSPSTTIAVATGGLGGQPSCGANDIVRGGVGRILAFVRAARRREGDLLGVQSLWAGRRAIGFVHGCIGGWCAFVCCAHRHDSGLLGLRFSREHERAVVVSDSKSFARPRLPNSSRPSQKSLRSQSRPKWTLPSLACRQRLHRERRPVPLSLTSKTTNYLTRGPTTKGHAT